MLYRADIDGLRAIAVMAVIVNHLNSELLPGGFIGVDMFFVISGYLISTQIKEAIANKQFSWISFYTKRIKRLAPALLIVIAVTVILSQLLLTPVDAKNVATSGAWSVLPLTNIYLWLNTNTGYFAEDSSLIPLLHLWSLSVEEQFYLIWPPAILLLSTIKRNTNIIIGLAIFMTVTIVLTEYLYVLDPLFSYYMLPTRIYEFVAGALLTYIKITTTESTITSRQKHALLVTGMILIAISMTQISKVDIYPGVLTIMPIIGTSLLLYYGGLKTSLVNKILTSKPFVFMGLISYSAYLWHWPLFSLYRYGYGYFTMLTGTAGILITIAIASVSYKYIEQPIRHLKISSYRTGMAYTLLPSLLIFLIIFTSIRLDGYGWHWNSKIYRQHLADKKSLTAPAFRFSYVCQKSLITEAMLSSKSCIINPPSAGTDPTILLWGDSNAAHYIGILGAFAESQGFSFRNIAISSCPPLLSEISTYTSSQRTPNCRTSLDIAINHIQYYETIIISANWPSYHEMSDNFFSDLTKTVQMLVNNGKNIVILGKAPVFENYDASCEVKKIRFPFKKCTNHQYLLNEDIAHANQVLSAFAATADMVEYIDFNDTICPLGWCLARGSDGYPLYFDSSHLSLPASWRLGQKIVENSGVPYPFNSF